AVAFWSSSVMLESSPVPGSNAKYAVKLRPCQLTGALSRTWLSRDRSCGWSDGSAGTAVPFDAAVTSEALMPHRVYRQSLTGDGFWQPLKERAVMSKSAADVRYEEAFIPIPPPNDIEFSGERKRVRCNELLGGTSRPRRFAGT